MGFNAWIRDKWPVLLVGLFVVPMCVHFFLGLPYSIFLDRDIELNGIPVTATVVSEREARLKGGRWHRMVKVQYQVDGNRYTSEFGFQDLRIGDTIGLRYSPFSPEHAAVDRPPLRHWNDRMLQRLLTAWILGLIFGGIWLMLLLKKPEAVASAQP
jgi:hypothetical protein